VNLAVTQMDQVVHQAAAQTEELSSTAQGLAAQALQLQRLVRRFKLHQHAVSHDPIVVEGGYPAVVRPALAAQVPQLEAPQRKLTST
jgi:methyl-accepting chemotaxis protein